MNEMGVNLWIWQKARPHAFGVKWTSGRKGDVVGLEGVAVVSKHRPPATNFVFPDVSDNLGGVFFPSATLTAESGGTLCLSEVGNDGSHYLMVREALDVSFQPGTAELLHHGHGIHLVKLDVGDKIRISYPVRCGFLWLSTRAEHVTVSLSQAELMVFVTD